MTHRAGLMFYFARPLLKESRLVFGLLHVRLNSPIGMMGSCLIGRGNGGGGLQ